jgi:histidinol-phosphate/aromatic aminotransferase/cobyric acid decarboxylase-like protein
VIKHTGELVTNTSYPGVTNLKNGTVKSFSMSYAEVICLSGDEINAEQIKSEYSLSTENVIIDKVGRFVTLDDYDGEELYLALKEHGILVRHFTLPRIKNFNRITIGTRGEIETLISEIQKILKEKRK